MNWEAIGAIGDLVGGLAVVASLVYVASQIRHSSRQLELSSRNMEASMYVQTSETFSRWLALLASDEGLAELWLRGLRDDELSPTERLRFDWIMTMLFTAYENNHKQVALGAVTRDTLEINREVVARMLRSPGGSRWWRERGPHQLTPEFRAEVEARVAGVGAGEAGDT